MRLLIIVDDYSGGAGNMAQLLALNGKKQGLDVSLLPLWVKSRPRYNLSGIKCFENLSLIHKMCIRDRVIPTRWLMTAARIWLR